MEESLERSPLLDPHSNIQYSGEINADNVAESDTEVKGCAPCNPHTRLHRYLALCIMCFLSFGSYFCYDIPSALQDVMTSDLDLTTAQFSALYSWYSWPNVILAFVGGYLIDVVFGLRFGAILFSIFCLVGQVILGIGSYSKSLWLMYAARFIFGIGGESLAVAQNNYAAAWFMGHELNMVFGIQLSMSRIGSTVNLNVMQPLYASLNGLYSSDYKYQQLGLAMWIAAGTCLFSLLCAIALAVLDRRANRIWAASRPVDKKDKPKEEMRLRDIPKFSMFFWIICVICVTYYVAVFPFIGLGQVFFERKYLLSPTGANAITGALYITSAIASPVSGLLIDMTGKNIFWLLGGVLLTLSCHAALAFTFISPAVVMVIMGVAYSMLASSLWPMVAYCIPQHQLGTAYGLMQSVQNLGLAVINMVSGAIVDARGYLILEVFFLAWLCLSLIFSVLLYLMDVAKGGALNRSSRERKRLEALDKEKKDAEESAHEE